MVDASLVSVPRQHVTEQERALLKEQAMPIEWKPAQRRQKDTEATWTKKHGQSYFGYKVLVSADRRYKLIRQVKVSTASENDTLHLEDVLDHANTGRDLYGDKGYVDGERERRLKAGGYTSNARRRRANRCPPAKRVAIPALREFGRESNTSSPPWSRWAENSYDVSVWIERPSNSRGR